jgi:hypothetical protein
MLRLITPAPIQQLHLLSLVQPQFVLEIQQLLQHKGDHWELGQVINGTQVGADQELF